MRVIYIFFILINILYLHADSEKAIWYKPSKNISWHWQLNGDLKLKKDAKLYIVDLFDTKESQIRDLKKSGKRVIAYFSAGSYEKWRDDASKFNKETLGKKMDDWDERWLDIRKKSLKSIMINRIKLAKEKGFDGIEADNVDGYSNHTGFNLTYKDQINYNIFLANTAHKYGLSIALKNDLEQIKDLVNYFDFHINEQCHVYDECEMTYPFLKANKPVLNAEYNKKLKNKICKDKIEGFHTLILPHGLDGSFSIECD
jgi:hypothetical protein